MNHAEPDLLTSLFSSMRALRAILALQLAEIGLQAGQDELLLGLLPDQPKSIGELAAIAAVRPSTVSKMVSRLERDGFLERLPVPGDSRKSSVRLLPKGVEARRLALVVRERLEAELTAAFAGDAILVALVAFDRRSVARLRRVRV